MSLARKFKTDEKCEAEGICLDYGDGQKIWIARAGGANRAFQKEAQRIVRKYRRQLTLNILPEEIQQKVAREAYARTVILRWEGVTDKDCGGDGTEPVPCTFENICRLLENLPELFNDIQRQAQNIELFLETLREDDAKN